MAIGDTLKNIQNIGVFWKSISHNDKNSLIIGFKHLLNYIVFITAAAIIAFIIGALLGYDQIINLIKINFLAILFSIITALSTIFFTLYVLITLVVVAIKSNRLFTIISTHEDIEDLKFNYNTLKLNYTKIAKENIDLKEKTCNENCQGHEIFQKMTQLDFTNLKQTQKYIREIINNTDNYNELLTKIKDENFDKKGELNDIEFIVKEINRSSCGRYLCVVSNLDYLEGTSEFRMQKYFLNFLISSRNNYIVRIFCFPSIKDEERDTYVIGDLDYDKRLRLLNYIICNKLAGVRTMLLLNINEKESTYFNKIDYVLGSPTGFETEENLQRKLYFSYTKEGNKTLTTSDVLLNQIFEDDFKARLKLFNSPNNYTFELSEKLNKSEIRRFLRIIGLTFEDYQNTINNLSLLLLDQEKPIYDDLSKDQYLRNIANIRLSNFVEEELVNS